MFEVDAEDIDYLTIAGKTHRARLYKPRGRGPFPAMVDGHGGAWIQGSFVNNDAINRPIAQGGIVVLSIDYRMPPDGTYPASIADMNYAVRWVKANAERCGTRPDMVGIMGTSSGGHLAALSAIKPMDPRYAAIALPGGEPFDARVTCCVAMWPVICPYTRYQGNKERKTTGDSYYAERVGGGLDQMKYWLTEEAMAEGSPMLALERGDAVEMPDMIYVQATGDIIHPRHCMDRFCELYKTRGGRVDIVLIEGEPYDLVRTKADSPEALRAKARMIEFIHEHSPATGR